MAGIATSALRRERRLRSRDVASETAMNVMLYTRAAAICAMTRTSARRATVSSRTLVDIDADPALREQFNECVPVVEIDGKIRFRGRVDPVLLRRLLRWRTARGDFDAS